MMFQKSLPFVTMASLALLGAVEKATAVVLFTDNFTVSANMNDPNFDIGNGRQGGTLATPTISYTSRFGADGHQQVGNLSTFPGNSNALLLDFGGASYLNYNFATVAAPISISFDGIISSGASSNTDNWIGMEIQSTNGAAAFVNSGDFGILFRGSGLTQYFQGSSGTVGGSSATSGLDVFNHYEVVLTDTAGTGSAFGSAGSKVAYYENGMLLGTANITQLTGGYIGFSATNIAGIDNLVIQTVVPEPGSLALLGLAGGLFALRRRK